LKSIFDNDDAALFPNQFVNARLLLDVKKGAVVVPSVAIQRGTQGAFVYVVKEDQTAAARPITVGATQGDDASVEGVKPGEMVVVDGADKLRDGSKVEIQSGDASAGPRKKGKS
jgi:multidrug efflux system membrane fusion protein